MGLCLLLLLPVLSTFLHISDIAIILLGLACKLVRTVWAGFCTETWMVYVSVVVGAMAGVITSALRSVADQCRGHVCVFSLSCLCMCVSSVVTVLSVSSVTLVTSPVCHICSSSVMSMSSVCDVCDVSVKSVSSVCHACRRLSSLCRRLSRLPSLFRRLSCLYRLSVKCWCLLSLFTPICPSVFAHINVLTCST